MRPHPPDAFSLGLGLVALLLGAVGLTGGLDLRSLDRSWVVPVLLAGTGAAVVVATVRGRR
jgi:hypothetical protein